MLDRSKCGALLALDVDAIKGMANQDFLDALRGKHDGLLMVPALADADLALGPPMPALADADDDPRLDVMPLMGPALPEDVVEAPAMVAAAPPPVVPALPPIAALVGPAMAAFAPVAIGELTIKYSDSHSSGIGRWYIQCKHLLRCFKYRQTNLHNDIRHLFAFLLAWARLGDSMPRALHTDPLLAPSATDIEAALLDVP